MSVVLFMAHEDTAFNRRSLARLRASLPGYQVIVAAFRKEAPGTDGMFEGAHVLSTADVRALPYGAKLTTFNPDDTEWHNEYPILSFYRTYPEFNYYWIVEFDVYYTGDWGDLFATLSSSTADLLGTAIYCRSDDPDWCHWSSFNLDGHELPREHSIKSFFPFMRVSRAALKAIDALYVQGVRGHSEAIWPTACSMAGLAIEDIGANGPFTPVRWRGRHYTTTPFDPHLSPGSFVFRPIQRKDDIDALGGEPMLWHPVKS